MVRAEPRQARVLVALPRPVDSPVYDVGDRVAVDVDQDEAREVAAGQQQAVLDACARTDRPIRGETPAW
jgi:hypothetical protein